MEVIHIKDI